MGLTPGSFRRGVQSNRRGVHRAPRLLCQSLVARSGYCQGGSRQQTRSRSEWRGRRLQAGEQPDRETQLMSRRHRGKTTSSPSNRLSRPLKRSSMPFTQRTTLLARNGGYSVSRSLQTRLSIANRCPRLGAVSAMPSSAKYLGSTDAHSVTLPASPAGTRRTRGCWRWPGRRSRREQSLSQHANDCKTG